MADPESRIRQRPQELDERSPQEIRGRLLCDAHPGYSLDPVIRRRGTAERVWPLEKSGLQA